MTLVKSGGFIHLDENLSRPYSGAHDQRRDHSHRSPPPHLSGMGGHLRLRYRLRRRIRSAAFSFHSAI
jgi:hypothetical protein